MSTLPGYTQDEIDDINGTAFGDRYRPGYKGIVLGEQYAGTIEDAQREFERYGNIAHAWFTFSGQPWEDPDDESTWGPEPATGEAR
jgi:hypothetical protein